MDRAKFFAAVRSPLFAGKLSDAQVSGIDAILDEAEKRGTPLKHLAYMLATAYHETARTMQPVRETLASTDDKAIRILDRSFAAGKLPWVKTPYWRKDKDGKSWLGRGLPQLTHKRNYEVMSPIVGVDLVADPNRAMEPRTAVKIMFEGMERGSFTGKKLADYIGAVADYVGARRIINGTDEAKTIAGYANVFERALVDGAYGTKPVAVAKPPAAPAQPAVPDMPAAPPANVWDAIFNIIFKLFRGGK